MLDAVAAVALVLAVLSFMLFVVLAIAGVQDKRRSGAGTLAGEGEEGVVDDVTKLIGQLEKLAGTLSKSGPWLSALITFFFCLSIAFGAASASKLSDKIPDTAPSTADGSGTQR